MAKRMYKRRPAQVLLLSLLWILLSTLMARSVKPAVAQSGALVNGLVAGSDTSTLRKPSSYGKPNQSRLWYNSRQNRWDALVPRDDNNGGTSASDHYIMQDVSGSQTFTGVELEDRDFGRPDSFWDDAGQKLYVLSSHPASVEFWRLGYDAGADSYNFEVGGPGAGVTVPGITHPNTSLGGNSPATLYVSPNGYVWASVMVDGALAVQYSADGGATWLSAPVNLDPSVSLGVTTWTHFEYQGVTYVGVFAGENGETGMETKFYFWTIDQNADPTLLANWQNDSANMPPQFGQEQADDHVSAARDRRGNMYFAVKTEGGAPTDPLIKLYRRTPDGSWSQYKVTETQEVPEESRPSIVIDHENDEIYIYTNGAEVVSPVEREGSRKKASLNALDELASAPFTVLFSQPNTIFTDLITPRQGVNPSTGIVVLAHNRTDETVWFSAEALPQGVTVPDVVGLSQADAEAAIIAAGLSVGQVTTAPSESVPPGHVISQDPPGGGVVAAGSPVDLVVSLGRPAVIDLGEAGEFAVLGLRGARIRMGGQRLMIAGDVGLGPKGVRHLEAGFIDGTFFMDPTARTKKANMVIAGGTVVRDLSQATADAQRASAEAANLTPTQTFKKINRSQVIEANGALTVIAVRRIELKDGQTLTLRGGPTDVFVINISKRLKLDRGSAIELAGGLQARNVLFNFVRKAEGEIKRGSRAAGIFLAPHRRQGKIRIQGNGTLVEGIVIAGREVTIKNNAQVIYFGRDE